MSSVPLSRVVNWCDRLLRPEEFEDWNGAVNGLQVENRGKVRRVAAAVDASLATIRLAMDARADLLIVHHGLFWSDSHPWTGSRYRQLRALLEGDVAVYSSHLPLDAHPRYGNSIRLAAALGLRRLKPFFLHKGRPIGFATTTRLSRGELVERVKRATGSRPKLIPGGAVMCRRIGVVTGGAGSELRQAVAEGIDTFVTGEGPHWTYALAEELGANVIYAGHYATETFGVKALAAGISRRFRIPWLFLDHPTGL
jgi:dinuclear metal center YbgI/SA1388 family protein